MRQSPHDREIFSLAVPALGALAAEPLYILADTAIVGHLGGRELAALALAGAVLTVAVALCNFLAYGTTAQVARAHGAGLQASTATTAAQALWLGLVLGAGLAAVCVIAAPELISVMGGKGETAALGVDFLRVAAIGLPGVLVTLAGQGYLRGIGNLTRPLVIVAAGNALNIGLTVVLVYPLGVGFIGAAIGTAVAQTAMGLAFAGALWAASSGVDRRPDRDRLRSLMTMGGHLLLRTASLLAAFTFCSAVAARIGEDALGAHQIAFQLFVFIALVLDALAIAGQVIVGRTLGAGEAATAREASRRMLGWSLLAGAVFAVVLGLGHDLIPRAFTSERDVLDQAAELWPLFVAMQPIGALAFAFDGILIGAGDSRYLAASMVAAAAVCIPLALIALGADWGITGVWWALMALMVVRTTTLAARFRGERWAVVGA